MRSVFVDTDVILDLFIRREPHHTDAMRLFSHLRRAKTACVTSAVVVANVYYLLAKIRNRAYALERVRRLRTLVDVAPVDQATVDAAIASPYKDFEDSLQHQCAVGHDCRTLITRNTRDFPKGRLSILNPGDYLDLAAKEKEG